MKGFLKQVIASLIGVLLASIVVVVLFTLAAASMMSQSSSTTVVKQNSVFVLKLGIVQERVQDNPFSALFEMTGQEQPVGLDDVLTSIQKAAENPDIQGIYLQANASSSMQPATAEAIRKALLDFKNTGKFIVAYGDNYNRNDYYIGSVADLILLNHQGMVEWMGMASTPIYYKDLLDKIGVHYQIFKVGTYKSAVEPYILNEMSDANRQQITSYTGDVWQQMLTDVSQSRHIPVDSLNAYADRGIALAEVVDYKILKLVDQLVYTEDIAGIIKQQMGLGKNDEFHTLYLSDMMNLQQAPNKFREGEIAVYYAVGEISSTEQMAAGTDIINQKKVCRDLRRLREDDEVKAVVLRVNSPGGSAFDSEQIWKEVVELKARKPVVVSMGDYAASGGYYISCAANYIFAEPTTLTGSIGIFGMVPEASELLTNKLGIHFHTVKTNKYADLGDISRPMNEGEKALMQRYVERGYELFTTRCADGRHLPQDSIKAIGEGRVWTGNQAVKIGLVDELGGLQQAVAKAKKMANVQDCNTVAYPSKSSDDFLSLLLEEVSTGSYLENKLKEQFGEYYTGFSTLRTLNKKDYLQARLPYILR